MTRRTILLIVGAAILAAAAVAVWRFGAEWPSAGAPHAAAAAADGAGDSAAAAGVARGPLTIDARRQQLIGVRTAPVHRMTMEPQLRAAGLIAFDETRQADVNLKFDGWIRDLFVDYTGRTVREGEPLFTIYSPDLLATQHELLLARKGHEQARSSPLGGVDQYAQRLVDAARERLRLWDIGPDEIAELERTGRATGVVTVRSPASGFIAEKHAVRGMRVMAGQSLYTIADTSVVWVEASVYEQELSLVRVGQSATVTLDAYPDAPPLRGRAIYIHPTVDERTRTGTVRFQFANPDGRLKPGMYVNVDLHVAPIDALTVPVNAVLDSGTEQIVFVAEGEGRFSPRQVKTGRRAGGDVEIVEGLREGEQVATSAAFFLDSESQLRAGLQQYEPAEGAARDPAAASDQVQVTFRSVPDPPRTGESTFEVTVRDASGQPIDDAEVTVLLFMPAMPSMNMPAMRSEATLVPAGDGVYRGTGQVLMGGRWDVTVTVRRGGQTLATRQFAVVAR